MERGRSLFIFKVKLQGHWTFIKKFRHLDSCGQDIARTMQSLCSNLVCTLQMEVEEAYLFKFKFTMSLSV